jgi:hypothetical protein
MALKFANSPKAKLSLVLAFLLKYIHECLQKDKTLLSQSFTSPKALLYQMYFIISRLDE